MNNDDESGDVVDPIPIPPYDDTQKCPECGDPNVAGAEIRGVYDGVLYWTCLGCDARWHRFKIGNPLRVRAEPFVKRRVI